MVLFLDTNILIDYLIQRPDSENSRKIIEYSLENDIDIFISATSIVNCFYILRKAFSVQELRNTFSEILKFIDVVGTGKTEILNAMEDSSFSDYEDCLQTECAQTVGADFIITRNIKDFSKSKIAAVTPEEFLDRV